VRVAALYDVHGNLAALEAVLAEVERERPDLIVFGGDVASGPFPMETLARIRPFAASARFVRGNGDREVVDAFDRGDAFDPDEPDAARRFCTWTARRIGREERDFLASFEDSFVLEVDGLGPTLFCHGSPRSDVEIVTSLTPDADLRRLLRGVEAGVVVCGHTHAQFDRELDGVRVVNAGSVGMAYEGRAGAFWALLGPSVDPRETAYDAERAGAAGLAAGYPDDEYAELLTKPPTAHEVAEFFERVAAGRGERGP
jgi:putative phosphoesterase